MFRIWTNSKSKMFVVNDSLNENLKVSAIFECKHGNEIVF